MKNYSKLILAIVWLLSCIMLSAQNNPLSNYPFGADAFNAYMKKNIVKPADFKGKKIGGNVVVGFTATKDVIIVIY